MVATAVAFYLHSRRKKKVTFAPVAAVTAAVTADVATDAAPPPAAAAETMPPPETPTVGARVVLDGLSNQKFNGQRGVIVGWDGVKGRFNVSLDSGRTIQVKPANLTEVKGSAVGKMTAMDLSSLSLSDHAGFTTAHAERVVALLSMPGSPVEAGCLLRCCTCIQWHAMATRNVKTGSEELFGFPDENNGKTIVLGSNATKLEQVRSLNGAPALR